MTRKEKINKFEDFCNERNECCDCCKLNKLGFCDNKNTWNFTDDELDKCIAIIDGKDNDNVNHPSHYDGEIECIDAMIQTQGVEVVKGFCIVNAFKYLWRWKNKNGVEDVKKAKWYLDKFLELEGETK